MAEAKRIAASMWRTTRKAGMRKNGVAVARRAVSVGLILLFQGRFDELPFTKPALCHCLDALSGRRTAHTSPESALVCRLRDSL